MDQPEQESRERYRWLVLLLLTAMRCRSCLKPQPWALDMFWAPLEQELGVSLEKINEIELNTEFFRLDPRSTEPAMKLQAVGTHVFPNK